MGTPLFAALAATLGLGNLVRREPGFWALDEISRFVVRKKNAEDHRRLEAAADKRRKRQERNRALVDGKKF